MKEKELAGTWPLDKSQNKPNKNPHQPIIQTNQLTNKNKMTAINRHFSILSLNFQSFQ